MRGRVMAILLAIALGGAPIGAPIVGWVADRFGPRWALGVGAAAGLAAAMVAIRYLTKHGALHVRIDLERLLFIARAASRIAAISSPTKVGMASAMSSGRGLAPSRARERSTSCSG